MDRKINVAILGVGNCASSLIQGVFYYKDQTSGVIPGLMNPVLGGYKISDINFVCGIDINETKVGTDLSEAIFAEPNCSKQFCSVPYLNAPVYRGMTLDGLGEHLKQKIKKSDRTTDDLVQILHQKEVDVLINYLPVGSEQATRWYMANAIKAEVGVINCIPVFIASDRAYWSDQFTHAGLPIIGDDVKSQVGATIVHRVLTRLFKERGIELIETSQLNVGGNMDFFNMLDQDRLVSKKISKTGSVQSQLDKPLDQYHIHIGPSDYVEFLQDQKWCYIHMTAKAFGGVTTKLELKLEVEDSPNSAGVVIDAIRCIKIALDRKIGGPLLGPSSYFMKTPPVQYTDDIARTKTIEFIDNDNDRKK